MLGVVWDVERKKTDEGRSTNSSESNYAIRTEVLKTRNVFEFSFYDFSGERRAMNTS